MPQVQIKVQKSEQKEFGVVDRLAMAMKSAMDTTEECNRRYKGVFTRPYGRINMNNTDWQQVGAEGITVFCDDIAENGDPFTNSWRWWGYRAEDIVVELGKLNVALVIRELEEKPNDNK